MADWRVGWADFGLKDWMLAVYEGFEKSLGGVQYCEFCTPPVGGLGTVVDSRGLFVGVDFAEEFVDGGFELEVFAFDNGCGVVGNLDVGFKLLVFEE